MATATAITCAVQGSPPRDKIEPIMPSDDDRPIQAAEPTVDTPRASRRSRRRRRTAVYFALFAACTITCDQPPPPPNQPRPGAAPPRIDVRHYARVTGDRPLSISNVVWIVQGRDNPAGPSAVTLMSEDTGAAVARLMFGQYVTVEPDSDWTRLRVDFGGAAYLDPAGNGVFTRSAAYQPKLAQLSIESVSDDEIKGAIRGEFHRIQFASVATRAETVRLEIEFCARIQAPPATE
jgi:hypothetical protein